MTLIRRFRDGFRRYFRTDIYSRVFPYIGPHKLWMAMVVAIITIEAGLALLEPWPMKILIDQGLSRQPLSGWLGWLLPFLADASAASVVVFAVLAGIALKLVGNVLGLASDYLKPRVNDSIRLNFTADLFDHLQRLSFKYHDQTSVGDSTYRMNNDTGWVTSLVWGNFRHLFTSALTLVIMLWIVVRLDWQIAVLAVATTPITYTMIGISNKFFTERNKRLWRMQSGIETIVQEVLSCLRVVKAFGQEQREQQRYEDQSWAAARARWRLRVQEGLFWEILGWVNRLCKSLILLLGAFHVLDGRLSLGELMVVLAYVGQIQSPLEEIGRMLSQMQISLASAERAIEVLDTPIEIQDRPGARTLARVEGAVAFEYVSFGYSSARPVLFDVGFAAKPGEVVAIVGPTGAGKTTIASLITRFYDPDAGRVTLDGHDLRDLTVRTLRSSIALVLQEPILFTGTIRDNIAYGRPDASLAEIEAAARAANAHDFITALAQGYDSHVGVKGVRLSGGERQRICVARAFLKDAPVLILDEPTSSVDSRTEQVILDALDRLMTGRTTFIIAHRLSTIRTADQIVVVDKGRIVEHGTHADLLRRNGLYAELYRIQSAALRQRATAEVPA
jgi:ATP-binding cassette subfamily B protein